MRFLTVVAAALVLALAGCSSTATDSPAPGPTEAQIVVPDTADGKACAAWYQAEVAMLQAVAAIQLSSSSTVLTNAFNTRRNELLAAYSAARDSAENADLKALFDTGLNTDSKMYFHIDTVTDADIQGALKSVENLIAGCATVGFDASGIFGAD